MFDRAQQGECFWPVKLPKRTEAGGIEEVEVLVRYRIFTRSELRARRRQITDAAEKLAAAKDSGEMEVLPTFITRQEQMESQDEDELRERIVGWKGILVSAESGEELPFSEADREWLLDDEPRFQALRRGLYEASRGAIAKN